MVAGRSVVRARTGAWAWAVLGVVAAWSVGFAVGDALAAPQPIAATTASTHHGRDSQDADARDADDSKDDFHWSWKLAAGKTLEIKGINGAIHAVHATNGEATVTARKHARRSDPNSVKIEVIEHDDGITICAVYPNGWGGKNTCEAGDHDHSNTRNNDVEVDFEVRVPDGVRFVGRTVNGDVEAEDLAGPIQARSVNGSIRVSTSKYAEAETVNGSIFASMGSADWGEGLQFSTVNGKIELDLPAETGANVHATTVNGDIDTDFPLTIRGRMSRHKIDATIGKGGPDLRLETVNGGIHLRRAS